MSAVVDGDLPPRGARQAGLFFAPFGPEGSEVRARSDRVFDLIVVPACDRHDLHIHRADRSSEPGLLIPQIVRDLLDSRVVICDITDGSPSVFYELGVAHACNLPVVLLARDATTLSFYVKDERIITTGSDDADAYAEASTALEIALSHALADTYVPRSHVGEALGLSGPFPPVLREAIRRASPPLYREAVQYDLRFGEIAAQHTLVRFGLSYRLVNRTRTDHRHTVGVVPMRPFTPIFARIGETDALDNPEHITERGWQVPFTFPSGSVTDVQFVVDVKYRMPDADIYATYLPATDFELKVRYPADRVRVVAEPMLRGPVSPEHIAQGLIRYHPRGALLAFEGFRLDWLAPRPQL
jgi:hypothetical protein